ncbi:MAG TPA: hypothetical protein VGM03_10190 [Phycisphaerae bacterium]
MRAAMMRMMFFVTMILICGSGCLGRLISEGAGAVTGARGKAVEIQPVRTGKPLSEYGSVEFESLRSDIGTQVPDEVLRLIPADTLKMLREDKLFTGGGPPLRISGQVIHYETGGAVDKAIGPLQEVIARITLSDGRSGAAIGEANVIGRAKSSTASGAQNLAEGCAKGIAGWIRKNHPAAKESKE